MYSRGCLTQISKAPVALNPDLSGRGNMCIANMVKPPLKPQRGDMWLTLEYLEQEEVDMQIAQGAADSEYRELHVQMVKEYESAAWEALRLGEDSS